MDIQSLNKKCRQKFRLIDKLIDLENTALGLNTNFSKTSSIELDSKKIAKMISDYNAIRIKLKLPQKSLTSIINRSQLTEIITLREAKKRFKDLKLSDKYDMRLDAEEVAKEIGITLNDYFFILLNE